MKKTIAILLSMFIILSFAACGNSVNRTEQSAAEGNLAEARANDGVFIGFPIWLAYHNLI